MWARESEDGMYARFYSRGIGVCDAGIHAAALSDTPSARRGLAMPSPLCPRPGWDQAGPSRKLSPKKRDRRPGYQLRSQPGTLSRASMNAEKKERSMISTVIPFAGPAVLLLSLRLVVVLSFKEQRATDSMKLQSADTNAGCRRFTQDWRGG